MSEQAALEAARQEQEDQALENLLGEDDDLVTASPDDPVRFIPDFPIEAVRPAGYNPRFLSEEAFARLQDSLRRFGVVKPVILNANNTIIAGHQRTKALTAIGATTVPAMQLPVTIRTTEEIIFNLLHNSVEEAGCVVYAPKGKEGYVWLEHTDVLVGDIGEAAVRVGACFKLVSRYGTWGSVVVDPVTGKVLLNSDYAVAVAQMRLPILAYYPKADDAAAVRQALGGEYGMYDTTQVEDKPYVQNVVQPNRLRMHANKGKVSYASRVWETLTLPRMTKRTRVLDFGAGKMDYVKHLDRKGYDVRAYEPFITRPGEQGAIALDVQQVVRQILRLNREVRRDGLYDLVNLDSVLNATSTNDYRDAVLITCAALLKPGGLLCLGTRSLAAEQDRMSQSKKGGDGLGLTFLDPRSNRAINFKGGQLYAMWFATTESLTEACAQSFEVVHVEDTRNATILAVCADPKPVEEERLRWALNMEFDMPYPEGYRHHKQGPLVEAVVDANRALGRLL